MLLSHHGQELLNVYELHHIDLLCLKYMLHVGRKLYTKGQNRAAIQLSSVIYSSNDDQYLQMLIRPHVPNHMKGLKRDLLMVICPESADSESHNYFNGSMET